MDRRKEQLKRASDRYRRKNKAKIAARDSRRYKEKRPKDVRARRAWHLKSRYNLTPEQYDQMLSNQGGGCAICGEHPDSRPLAVDHDHSTGAVRGLLCHPCNAGLGLLKESESRLSRAIQYLRMHRNPV